jgi:hypothetical protein
MKLCIVGGGGFRVPLVYGALLDKAERLGLDEVVLHDVDADRLGRIGAVLDGLADERGQRLPFRVTTDLDDAVEGADFVFCAIRAGQLEGRVVDESVPLGLGVLGQETTGPGGICFALRTIPPMIALAETMAARAPRAWMINFTNPAGMVTEAVQRVLGERAVGVCDSPSGLCRRVARALGRAREDLAFDYFGLNHLGWLKGVRDRDAELLPALLADDERLSSFEEGRLFGGDWLRSLEMIPNEYLYFFYYASDTVRAIRERPASRGAFLLEQQRSFYAQDGQGPREARAAWGAPRPRAHVHGGGAQRGGRRRRARDRGERRLRGRGDGGARGDGARHARRADPQHREPLGAAGARLARGRGGPLRGRPCGSAAAGGRAGARARRCSGGADEGRRAHDDRGGSDRLAGLGDPRARAPSARALGVGRAGDLRRVPGAAARAAAGVPVDAGARVRRALRKGRGAAAARDERRQRQADLERARASDVRRDYRGQCPTRPLAGSPLDVAVAPGPAAWPIPLPSMPAVRERPRHRNSRANTEASTA